MPEKHVVNEKVVLLGARSMIETTVDYESFEGRVGLVKVPTEEAIDSLVRKAAFELAEKIRGAARNYGPRALTCEVSEGSDGYYIINMQGSGQLTVKSFTEKKEDPSWTTYNYQILVKGNESFRHNIVVGNALHSSGYSIDRRHVRVSRGGGVSVSA